MAKLKKGDKVKLDCLTEQLRNKYVFDWFPGEIVYVIKYAGKDKEIDYYELSENIDDSKGYILPENYLEKQ